MITFVLEASVCCSDAMKKLDVQMIKNVKMMNIAVAKQRNFSTQNVNTL